VIEFTGSVFKSRLACARVGEDAPYCLPTKYVFGVFSKAEKSKRGLATLLLSVYKTIVVFVVEEEIDDGGGSSSSSSEKGEPVKCMPTKVNGRTEAGIYEK